MATKINTTFPGYGAIPTSVSVTPTTSTSSYTINPAGTYKINTTTTSPWIVSGNGTGTNHLTNDQSGSIKLIGKNADIDINGVSLKDTLAKIEERLAILKPNAALEKDWEELKELGDSYRKLEAEITEKMKAWDILKEE
jgi:hypothetical protein